VHLISFRTKRKQRNRSAAWVVLQAFGPALTLATAHKQSSAIDQRERSISLHILPKEMVAFRVLVRFILLFFSSYLLLPCSAFRLSSSSSFSNPILSNALRASVAVSANGEPLKTRLDVQQWLVGAYDNKQQADADAALGRPTARAGGHEYVKATAIQYSSLQQASAASSEPLLENVVITSYWLGGNSSYVPPSNPFRFRYYAFENDESGRYISIMKLYKPSKDAEIKLKECSFDLSTYLPTMQEFEEIEGCDVAWSYEADGEWVMGAQNVNATS
jgi:hypothetical protein